MKPQELGCFEQVKAVLGEQGAIEELQKVIDCDGVNWQDKNNNNLIQVFEWATSPQDFEFWVDVQEGTVPQGYTPPSATKNIIELAWIAPEQMDEIKEFIAEKVKENLYTIRGMNVDSFIIDDPAANDDIFDKPEVVAWEPVGGDYYVDADGGVEHTGYTNNCYSEFGTERPTLEQAKKARDEMRVFNRLLAYRDEFDPDFDFEADGFGYSIYPNGTCGFRTKMEDYATRELGTVYFSGAVAEELCKKLSSGEVVL